MDDKESFSITARVKSVGYAIEGIVLYLKTQHNAIIQLIGTIVVVVLGFLFNVNKTEWTFLVVAIAMVIVSEMFNTAIEFLTDIVKPEIHPQAKKVKDVAAGAVLVASMGASAIGLIIFLPKILNL